MAFRSRRVPSDLSPNPLAVVRDRLGRVPFDLTVSNPTLCDLPYPPDLLRALGDSRGLVYKPDPRGSLVARQAVAADYTRWGIERDPERIVLTASTSEAYGYLFRLLCDPGDAVLVPSPSYPLFEHLARLEGVSPVVYPLDPVGGWRPDFPALETAPDRARAVVVVHPNNPTGSFTRPGDRDRLIELCRERSWALIADEIFLPFPLDGGQGSESSFAEVDGCLCCTLGGFSKSLGLPQLKLAWIVVGGPEYLVGRVLEGLDFVADSYLSVSTPTALAAPKLIAAAAPLQSFIADRCRTNIDSLRRLATGISAVTIAPVGGGWSAVLRVPSVVGEEALCVALLERHGVAVHPGRFFGFPNEGWLVASLLPPPEIFAEGARLMLDFIAESLG
jgi:alanine-synthesizing transaminase